MKIKLATGVFLQGGISSLLLIGTLIFTKLTPSLIFIAVISFILSATAISFNNFIKDYKKLYLNWNNLIELSSRGVNQLLFAFIMAFPSATHVSGIIYIIALLAFIIFNTLILN